MADAPPSVLRVINASRELDSSSKLLLGEIFRLDRSHKGCYARQAILARRVGLRVQAMKACRTKLREAGFLNRSEERLSGDRRQYTCLQLVASYIPGQPLQPGDFDKRFFDDLSETGFAYFTPHPPETKQVAVALGVAPFTFLTADVVNQALSDGPEGRQYRIGCHFTGRLDG